MAIKEITRNKKYQIEVVIGYNGSKKIRHYETFYGKKSDAQIRESEIKYQIKNNTYIPKNQITMTTLIDEWLKSKKDTLEIKTYNSYSILCGHIKDLIGHIKVKNINVKILEDFYKEIKNTNISSSTLQRYYILVNMILDKAIIWNYISINPNKKIEKPKARHKEISCYSPEEVEKLINALQSESLKYQAIILLALDTAARRGEITRFNLG